jgi:mono/diheme cytochrome c family protein
MYLHKGDELASALTQSEAASLNAYFDAIKNGPNAIPNNIKIQWVTQPALHVDDKIDDKAATASAKAIMMLPGDPESGKTIFSRSCADCHSMTQRKAGPPLNKAMDTPIVGAKIIRCGSGAMPFYAKDLLSDQQVADVIAYIQQQSGK